MTALITGAVLRDAVIYASAQIQARQQEIDALNVFPVPDGDTGTNMSMTLSAAARDVAHFADSTALSAVAQCVASSLLHGARGNSGVILSLIFRGFAGELQGAAADGRELAEALWRGTETAYKAVLKPIEGTILTVIRAASDAARLQVRQKPDAVAVFSAALRGAKTALAQTPDLLPVLKKANVVDAGGQGLVVIFEAMLAVFRGDAPALAEPVLPAREKPLALVEQEISFLYCTECLVQRQDARDAVPLRTALAKLGDSMVFLAEEDCIKLHIHTNQPDAVLTEALCYGQLEQIKIENMQLQHSAALAQGEEAAQSVAQEGEKRPFGIVTVAAGEGLRDLFSDLGADYVVSGGQTMNPSTDEILAALECVRAEHIFLLPNNRNIHMAAQQAAALAGGHVQVVETLDVPQGIAAVLALDELGTAQQNAAGMHEAIKSVTTAYVTFAARDREFPDLALKRGDVLGVVGGEVKLSAHTPEEAAAALLSALYSPQNHVGITLYYGEGITARQAENLAQELEQQYPKAAVSAVYGGQPVYYYMLAVE